MAHSVAVAVPLSVPRQPAWQAPQRVLHRVVKDERHAVGKDEAQRQANRVGDQAVRRRVARARVRPIHFGDARAVYLVGADDVVAVEAEGGVEALAILLHVFGARRRG